MDKKILFLTGTRADFGKIKSLIKRVEALQGYEYFLFVTGMHMMQRYGGTVKEIKENNFSNIYSYHNQSENEPMDIVLANTINGLSRYVHESKPDMIIIHGDRVESLAGAIVGSLNNIKVMHIEGGERSGTIDELIRHSVTKLSHIHLVANEEAKKRVIQLGEQPDSVYVFGSADIDYMKPELLPSLEQVKNRYEIPYEKYHIVLFHPVTTEIECISEYANNLVKAIRESTENYIVIYPNNDSGSNEILRAYKTLNNQPNIKIFPSIRFEYFLTLIHHAKSMIGNSSAGIREAPIFGLPSINIGTRQNNRFKSESIFDCSYDYAAIKSTIEKVSSLDTRFDKCDHFGLGNSAEIFEEIITSQKIWDLSVQKGFYDIKNI